MNDATIKPTWAFLSCHAISQNAIRENIVRTIVPMMTGTGFVEM